MKKSKLVAILAATTVAASLALVPAATAATKTKACLALDTGGVDDKSFNAASWAGAQAIAKANKNVTVSYLPAASGADYAPNIKKFVDQKCNVIIGVGFAISGAIVASAKANPNVKYAVVDDAALDCNADYSVCNPVKNVKGLTFKTQESSFLAGYAAAAFSTKGVVATYGGAPYPTVTAFMDGFAQGVYYYNQVKKKGVRVLGWNRDTKNGEFVGDFANTSKALQISKNFEQAGADVIFPVAGGLGGATAGNSLTSKKSVVIWVDTDGVKAAPQYRKVLLTSVVKGVDTSVQAVILDQANGKFSSTGYFGNLKNKGTYIAPYYDLIRRVPTALRTEVTKLGNDIRNGKVSAK